MYFFFMSRRCFKQEEILLFKSMSIKIYNGYYLPFMELNELYQIVQGFKTQINMASEELFNKAIAVIATDIIDSIKIGLQEHKRSSPVLVQAYFKLIEKQEEAKRTNSRSPLDFSCSVCFIPVISRKKIYCLLYTEQKDFKNIWEAVPGVIFYPYWDNTDKPREISDKEWWARGQEWSEALGKGTPADAGFLIECGNKGFPSVEKMLPFIPSFTERVEKNARRITIKNKMKEIISSQKNGNSTTSTLYPKILEWLKTPEGQKILQQNTIYVAGILKKEITADVLLSNGQE